MLKTFRQSDTAKAALILFTLSFILFARVLLRPSLIVTGSDFVQFYFWEQFTRQELAQGNLPLWNPFFFSGYPFSANPQMLLFYPPAMFLRFFPLDYAFGLGMMLHIGWTGLGMYVLARYQKSNHISALISAIIFMFSGVVITHIKGGHLEWVYSIAWLPWVVLAWAKTLNGSIRSSLIAGVFTAMMFLAGAARIAGVAETMVIVLGIIWLWGVAQKFSWRRLFNAAVRIIVGGTVMIGIAAPQLLPSLEFASLSSRAQGLALECATNLSLTFFDFLFLGLARIAGQFPEWERNGYVGAMALTLAIIGFAARHDSRKWLWIVWGSVGIALSVGPLLPVYELARNLIPGLAIIRQPFTFIVMISFALAGLAGLGTERVLESPRKVYALIGTALLLGSIFFDAMFYQSQLRPNDNTFYSWAEWIVSFSSPRYMLTVIFLFGLGHWWHGRVGVIGLGAILSVDLLLFAYIYIPISNTPFGSLPIPSVNPIEARVLSVPYAFADRTMSSRVANAQGYAPIVLKSYADFVIGNRAPSRCPDFEHAEIDATDKQMLKLLSVSVIDRNGVAEPLNEFYPRAFWVGEAGSVQSNADAIHLAWVADFDPTKKVIVDGSVNQSILAGKGSIRITEYGTQDLTVLVDSTSDGWFYINDVWYPGWRAWVNGKETPVYRANGTFRAVQVPAGQSTIFMKYESTYLNLGIWIAAVTMAVLVIAVSWNLFSMYKLSVEKKP